MPVKGDCAQQNLTWGHRRIRFSSNAGQTRLIKCYSSIQNMNQNPLPSEPSGIYLLYKSAYGNWFSFVFGITFLGFAAKIAKPESIVLSFFGLLFLYLFANGFAGSRELSTLYKKLNWYKSYCRLTYLSGAATALMFPFEFTQFFAILLMGPVFINVCIYSQITVNTYKMKYTELFGVIDV